MRAIRVRLLCAGVVILLVGGWFAAPVVSQQWDNIVAGLSTWKVVQFYPDPAFDTSGADEIADQHFEVNNWVNTPQDGGANTLTLMGLSVPNAAGDWGTNFRMKAQYRDANGVIQRTKGFEWVGEGRVNTATGVESSSRAALWDFTHQRSVLYYDSYGYMNNGRPMFNIMTPLWTWGSIYSNGSIHTNQYQAGPTYKNGVTGSTCSEWTAGICT